MFGEVRSPAVLHDLGPEPADAPRAETQEQVCSSIIYYSQIFCLWLTGCEKHFIVDVPDFLCDFQVWSDTAYPAGAAEEHPETLW